MFYLMFMNISNRKACLTTSFFSIKFKIFFMIYSTIIKRQFLFIKTINNLDT